MHYLLIARRVLCLRHWPEKIQSLYHCCNPAALWEIWRIARLRPIQKQLSDLADEFLFITCVRCHSQYWNLCIGGSFFSSPEREKEKHLWFLPTVWERRWLPLLLSISVTMTGDGGENDFGFCSDALLWRITLRCRLLAGPVSLACVTRASRRVSHNNFVCMCL